MEGIHPHPHLETAMMNIQYIIAKKLAELDSDQTSQFLRELAHWITEWEAVK